MEVINYEKTYTIRFAFLLVVSSTGCTILNDSQSSIENDDKLIIDQTSTKNTSDVLIQALETNDAELFKSVFSEQTLKLQPDIDEGIKYIFNIFEGDNLEIVYENQSSESFLICRQNVYGRSV